MRNPCRRQMFVDRPVQGTLVLRVLVYGATCLLSVFVMLFGWSLLTGPARISWTTVDYLWFHYGPAFVAATLILPLVMWDAVRVSNRFAGPILRLRRELKRLADGEEVHPIYFREGDFWRDVANDYNRIALRLKELEAKATAVPELEEAERFMATVR
jgi:hypothetical protein